MANARVWSVFHDGLISCIDGDVPGALKFTIEAEYLRKQFADPGNEFIITISGCRSASFKRFSDNETMTWTDAIRDYELEILTARAKSNSVQIVTSTGILTIEYEIEFITLDTGRRLNIADVEVAAKRAYSAS